MKSATLRIYTYTLILMVASTVAKAILKIVFIAAKNAF